MSSNALTPATPQRPLPGAFLTTPAPAPSIFSQNAQALRHSQQQQAPAETNAQPAAAPALTPIERAAKTINETLAAEARFPALEEYIQNGVTSEYELHRNPAWHPFQTLKQYDLPPKILEQANQSSMRMAMGLFAPLGHAYATLDNCLYLWDYTMPNPTLIGFEENKSAIEAVKLVTPRAGVFIKEITHVIVVATHAEMLLLGVSPSTTSTGAKTIALYNTRMTISLRGVGVRSIDSTKDGRIFFTGTSKDDIFEFRYRSDESWFKGRGERIEIAANPPSIIGGAKIKAITQYIAPSRNPPYCQILVDDSRGFIYTLDEANTIKVWLIRDYVLASISRSFGALLQSSGHFTARTELLTGQGVYIASISAIPAGESSRLALMATTNTGVRLYISLTRGFTNNVDAQYPPTQMAITHVRLPPRDPASPPVSQQQPGQPANVNEPASQYLIGTSDACRVPPGYSIVIVKSGDRSDQDRAFLVAIDSARLKNLQDTSTLTSRFVEQGQWLALSSMFLELAVMTGSVSAAPTPTGFGNELAVQFDQPSLEFALLTSSGIQLVRRRRLVDMFASIMRYGSADEEGVKGDIKRFIRRYGRGEVAATALAVACGQGLDVTSDARVANVTDPEILERARSAFIEHGGKPEFNANSVVENNAIDNVTPSPRHEGFALYVSRLIRSVWKAKVIAQQLVPGQGPVSSSTVPLDKLRSVQKSLSELQRFLDANKSFIEGLSGPQALSRLSTRQDEVALQGEHRAMNSLLQLVRSLIEGISFALVLFDERIDDILAVLSPEHKQRALDLTYEGLFASTAIRGLAKELVKAIVNRNIAKGANVETVAEALRRRCGSFCSSEDVVTFKAQEQMKKAQEVGAQTETGRALLNESQHYFQKVANSLTDEQLQDAVHQYVQAQFWAGAIQLCLAVAQAKDRANRALGWVKDGSGEADPRKAEFDARKKCYDLIFSVIKAIDEAIKQSAGSVDGVTTTAARRRNEADNVINDSEDQVFQTCLYDWYAANQESERLLDISSPFVVEYLERRAQQGRDSADLLSRYYAHSSQYLEAARVQFELAVGFFELSLEERIGYLGRARINASTRQASIVESRQSKQQLLREISDRLDVANIQDDILQKIKDDPRLSDERRPHIIGKLNGAILSLGELFNEYADQAEYHDICLLIYQCADHRNPMDIRNTWQQLIERTNSEAPAIYGKTATWEIIGDKVREVGRKLSTSDIVFPVPVLLPMLERYAIDPRKDKPPQHWAVDVFLDLEVPYETLLHATEQVFYSNESPFTGTKRRVIAGDMIYIAVQWLKDSLRKGERVLYGSEENASMITDLLAGLLRGDSLVGEDRRQAEDLSNEIRKHMR
ncbi:hypothetical protein AMS68_006227 [Peltaster fructicola]|uniref:Nucleoporin Nup133/Nup155-like N-terminal domain-containing protein n=1 Tax=Peltaster fructicola TaxID=286661 RepID=A0A6H0Y241_9PEZI|nr:hypothetical protein AMS68_006227 [Peltaster fructicola]